MMDFFFNIYYNTYINTYIESVSLRLEELPMSTTQDTMQEQVEVVIEKLRPFLLRDGGDCELVDVEDGIVKLRLLGACGTCPSSTITLKAGIERAMLEEVPGFVEVEQVF